MISFTKCRWVTTLWCDSFVLAARRIVGLWVMQMQRRIATSSITASDFTGRTRGSVCVVLKQPVLEQKVVSVQCKETETPPQASVTQARTSHFSAPAADAATRPADPLTLSCNVPGEFNFHKDWGDTVWILKGGCWKWDDGGKAERRIGKQNFIGKGRICNFYFYFIYFNI